MKNITALMLVSSLVMSSAFAGDLDKILVKVNSDLNPKNEGDVGFEVDYRQETNGKTFTWVNIQRVKKTCGLEVTSYLENGKIVRKSGSTCKNKMVFAAGSLSQVSCEGLTGQACVNALAREVNTQSIQELLNQHVTDVYVK
jgi:hypothetical protein